MLHSLVLDMQGYNMLLSKFSGRYSILLNVFLSDSIKMRFTATILPGILTDQIGYSLAYDIVKPNICGFPFIL